MKQKNTQNISRIVMNPIAICYCPLGNDYYTNRFKIIIEPDSCFPDYCDIENYLEENIRGKTLIIEDAIDMLYNYLQTEYKPISIKIISNVSDASSHSPVTVIK